MEQTCPCGSGQLLSACCAPIIGAARLAATPVELMRSRYSAYVLQDINYLISSWHPDCAAHHWREQLVASAAETQWRGLTIVSHQVDKQGSHGQVEFIARFYDVKQQRPGFIHERSRFVRLDGCWYYRDGTHLQPNRNDPCPCGSGKKYKKCCGQ